MYKSLLVGCGKIAGGVDSDDLGTHAGAISAEHRLELCACVDNDLLKAKQFSKQNRCKPYSNLEQALRENSPEVVSVCTPDTTHYAIVKQIIDSGSAPQVIFLEKPACSTQEEYKELQSVANKNNVFVVVNHSRRFNNKYQTIKKLLLSGEIGDIWRVNAIYYSGWFHNGTHIVDTLSYLLDDTINWDRVTGVINSPHDGDPTLELEGHLVTKNAKVVISAIDESLYQLFDIDLWCQSARIRIENFGNKVLLERMVVNNIGERVLEPQYLDFLSEERTEMQIAISRICDYLDTQNIIPLEPVLLGSIEATMQTLWRGVEMYKNRHKNEET